MRKTKRPWILSFSIILTIVIAVSCRASVEENMTFVDHWPYGGPWSVAARSNCVYLGSGGVVYVLDVSNKSSPEKIAEIETKGVVQGMDISGSYLFVADYSSGLLVIDVSDARFPSVVGTYDTPSHASDIVVEGDYAYIADGFAGLLIIDVSIPSSPLWVGSYDTPTFAMSLAVSGENAYIADRPTGPPYNASLQIIDISNPVSPIFVASYTDIAWPIDVAVDENHAYVTNKIYADMDVKSSLEILDISNPALPILEGSYGLSWGLSVALAGDYAYVADHWSGLRIIDISDSHSPYEVPTVGIAGYPWGVTIDGNDAYVAATGFGLQVVDISNPSQAFNVGSFQVLDEFDQINGFITEITVDGDYAYVGDTDLGLQIIDISYPILPFRVGSHTIPGSVSGIALQGEYAYIADRGRGLSIFDVTDPSAPSLVGSCRTPDDGTGSIAISGIHAYMANGRAGFRIFDVSDPTAPAIVGTYHTPGSASSVALQGHYAYVAELDFGLRVIDVSNPSLPVLVGSLGTSGRAFRIALSGDYAYLARWESEFWIIDISQPELPSKIAVFDTPGSVMDVKPTNKFVYLADALSGLWVADISNPSQPLFYENYCTPMTALAVEVTSDYVLVGDAGLAIFDRLSEPCNIDLISPIGGENWNIGEVDSIRWTSSGTSGNVRIDYSTDVGSSWHTVVGNTPDNGAYLWTVPSTISSSCLVRISDAADTTCMDESDSAFSIRCGPCVLNAEDNGSGSLRDAMFCANASPGLDTVTFDISGDGPHTINLSSPLPVIIDPMFIDGYSQPGSQPNTNPSGDSLNSVLMIELDGSDAGAGANGLEIVIGNCIVRGLAINQFGGNGIHLQANGNNVIEGNYIGTDVTGTVNSGNGMAGIRIDSSSQDNIIGLDNLIAFNGTDGIYLGGESTQNNIVDGNIITDNIRDGVRIENVMVDSTQITSNAIKRNLVGIHAIGCTGLPTIEGNVIEDNVEAGILIEEGGGFLRKSYVSDGESIENNTITLNSDGIHIRPLSYFRGSRCQSTLDITHNNIYANAEYGILNEDPVLTVIAENNWWGDTSGPYNEETNPNGQGNPVGGAVIVSDWFSNTIVLSVSAGRDMSGTPGSEVTVRFRVYNMDQSSRIFDMDLTDSLGWGLNPNELSAEIGAFSNRSVLVHVAIPSGAAVNTENKVMLTGILEDDPSVTDSDWLRVIVAGVKGDVTQDQAINVLDVLRVVNIILGIGSTPTEYEYWAADCNGDGTVNILDALGTVNVILEIGECQP